VVPLLPWKKENCSIRGSKEKISKKEAGGSIPKPSEGGEEKFLTDKCMA